MHGKPLCAQDGIETIIEKYKTMVYGIALTHVKNKNDADDVFQDVFLTYYQKNKSFNDEEHRKAWLINTTINYCKKTLGSTWRKKTQPLADSDPIFEFSSKEENLVYIALCKQPEKYRIVLQLFYFENMSVDEISKALNIRAGTIRMQLTRGREMMREKLKGDYLYE